MSEKKNMSAANIPHIGPGGKPGRGPGGPMGARLNAEKPKNTRRTLGRLIRYIGKSGVILAALLLIMIAVTGADLVGPFFQQKAIDAISLSDGKLSVDMQAMAGYLALMGVVFAVSAALSYFQGILAAKLSQSTVYAMRNDLFRKISRLPISYTDSHRHGDIMSRMTNDVENVSNAVSQSIATLFSAVLTLAGAFCMMMYYSPVMTAVAVVTIPLTILVSSGLSKFMRKYFVRQQKLLGQLNSAVEESVTGYKTVVAYGKEDEAVEKFGAVAEDLRKCSISARIWGSVMGPIMNFLGNFQYVLLAATGGFLILSGRGRITVGSIQAMLQYSKKFSHPINMIANQYSTILTALAGAERIFEIMDAADEIDGGKTDISLDGVRGDIEFENLQFGYVPGEPVLKGLDLSVGAGKKIAIVGATGSGKTTIVNLLTRFYELDGGRITIDGVNITDIPKEKLRKMIAVVLQDTVLFSDTIGANIRYGRENATDEEVRAAADTAMAARFIDRLPQGYETMLSESGTNLSEGQRQLLSISRAVLADPKILILDEATSSVDTRTELKIQQAMGNLMRGRTSLIIAHRLSTIRDADMIVVVNGGRIVESGNHEELLALGGEYSKLYSSQFAGVAI
ncbi:MAG: ABC transporter ATP-binding protein [Clostridiales bacterium]|nr:ABC transporter ATP-binding protein [Clostridiales bacterium]